MAIHQTVREVFPHAAGHASSCSKTSIYRKGYPQNYKRHRSGCLPGLQKGENAYRGGIPKAERIISNQGGVGKSVVKMKEKTVSSKRMGLLCP